MYDQTTWDRSIALVSGYHTHCYPPKTAYRANLRHRFAIILQSDCTTDPNPSFDVEFFLALLKTMQAMIRFDRQIIALENSLSFETLDELAAHYFRIGLNESEAPRKIAYYNQSTLVCEEETEFWNMVGGPSPYHDSRTFSFYTPEDRFEAFASRIAATCTQFELDAPMRYWEEEFKRPFSWYKRPLQWLFR
jgi:hypothetical protein